MGNKQTAAHKKAPAHATAAKTLRIPITNVYDGSDYSAQILVGSNQVPANVILDTGSSTLAVVPTVYDASQDKDAKPTSLAQLVLYGTPADPTGWLGPIVNTSMSLGAAGNSVSLSSAPIAITDFQSKGDFGGSIDGIMGLAYYGLNDAYDLAAYLGRSGIKPPLTFPWPFPSSPYSKELQQFTNIIRTAKIAPVDVEPYFDELEKHGLTLNKFAFYTLRSCIHVASNNANAVAADPLNNGVFVLGGGEEEKDLYTGSFIDIDVLHDVYYNTNLISVQVAGCKAVAAKPLQATYDKTAYSNSIIDSGTSTLVLANDVFQSVVGCLESLNSKFFGLIRQALSSEEGIPVSMLNLAEWPNISFTLTGANGKPATLTCAPGTYWQLNSPSPGMAAFQMEPLGGDASAPNQSILGLPLFNNYYTVFDRSQGKGNGVISFALIKHP